MKCKQPCLGFEIVSLISFPLIINCYADCIPKYLSSCQSQLLFIDFFLFLIFIYLFIFFLQSSAQKSSTQSFIPKIVSTKSISLQFTTTTSTVNSVTKSPRTQVALTNKNKMVRSAKKSPVKTAKKTPAKSLSDSVKKTIKHPSKMSPTKSPLVKKPCEYLLLIFH